MTKNTPIIWYSPATIEVFIPIIESQIMNISVEKTATLAEFIAATKDDAMGILIYPEQSAREYSLWSQLSSLTKKNPNVVVFESDVYCKKNGITGNISAVPTPGEILKAIQYRVTCLSN